MRTITHVLQATHISGCDAQTHAIAAGLASVLRAGDVVALSGDLGAGKTTFARGVAVALGAQASLVASPTFVFVHVYPLAAVSRETPALLRRLVHVDAYRLGGSEDLEALGWDQLFDPSTRQASPDAAALIEWPERIADHLPPSARMAQVVLRASGADERTIVLTLPEAWRDREGVELLLGRPAVRCPSTGVWVAPTSKSYPFANQRAQQGDLYSWLSERYVAPRPLRPDDEDAPR